MIIGSRNEVAIVKEHLLIPIALRIGSVVVSTGPGDGKFDTDFLSFGHTVKFSHTQIGGSGYLIHYFIMGPLSIRVLTKENVLFKTGSLIAPEAIICKLGYGMLADNTHKLLGPCCYVSAMYKGKMVNVDGDIPAERAFDIMDQSMHQMTVAIPNSSDVMSALEPAKPIFGPGGYNDLIALVDGSKPSSMAEAKRLAPLGLVPIVLMPQTVPSPYPKQQAIGIDHLELPHSKPAPYAPTGFDVIKPEPHPLRSGKVGVTAPAQVNTSPSVSKSAVFDAPGSQVPATNTQPASDAKAPLTNKEVFLQVAHAIGSPITYLTSGVTGVVSTLKERIRALAIMLKELNYHPNIIIAIFSALGFTAHAVMTELASLLGFDSQGLASKLKTAVLDAHSSMKPVDVTVQLGAKKLTVKLPLGALPPVNTDDKAMPIVIKAVLARFGFVGSSLSGADVSISYPEGIKSFKL